MAHAVRFAGLNAIVFLGFVAAGCGYIVLAKLADFNPFLVTFVPVATMLGYALLIYSARALRLRDDQSGDNLYYMGFLFTLTSLAVSLYQFDAAHAAEEIVQNFGIAIGSTIAGIGLRVIFNQMRRDPAEVEQIMRLELAEAARRVRRELDATVVEFGHHRRAAQQASADSFVTMTERFDAIAAKILAGVEELAARSAQPLEATAHQSGEALAALGKNVGDTIAASAQNLEAQTDRVAIRLGATAVALEEVLNKLGALQTPDRVIEVRLEPLTRALAEAMDRLTQHTDAQAQAIEAALERAGDAAQSSHGMLIELRREADAGAFQNRVALEAAADAMGRIAQLVGALKADVANEGETLRVLLERADRSMRTFTDVLVRSGIEAVTQADSLRETLAAIEAASRGLTVAAARISALVAAPVPAPPAASPPSPAPVSRLAPRREAID
jgi:hypothetical protein